MARKHRSSPPPSSSSPSSSSPASSDGSMTRRRALQHMGVGLSALAAACASPSEGSPAEASDVNELLPSDPALAAPDMARGPLTKKELLGSVDSVIVLMMENRSFDHYLGALKLDATYPGRLLVNGLSGAETNPDPMGMPVKVFPTKNFTPDDPPHSFDASHSASAAADG